MIRDSLSTQGDRDVSKNVEEPSCKDFVGRGWNDHGDDAEGVMNRLPRGLELVREASDAPALAALIVHVAGEHLGYWQDGLDLLERLSALEPVETGSAEGRAIVRSQAVLHYCAGDTDSFLRALDDGHPEGGLPRASTRSRVLAIAAAALVGQSRLREAAAAFEEAVGLLAYGPGKDDPAARAVAITGNNLACELEEKSGRSAEDDALLESAALAARRFWEIAGDWTNVKIAEVRLTMTFLALARPDRALEHAKAAVALCEANAGGPADRFFPHHALALVHHAQGHLEAAAAERERVAGFLPSMGADWGDSPKEALARLDALLAG